MLHELTRRPDATDAAAESPPNWSAQKDDIFCPLCDYNLRGLIEPRCPECGYRFAWSDLLDAHRRIHPWLFEHHPESNIRSFLATARAIQRPSRFWPTLHPAQPSRPGRMLAYWLIGVVLFMISFAVCAIVLNGCMWYAWSLNGWTSWRRTSIWDLVTGSAYIAGGYAVSYEFLQSQLWCAALALGWPSVTFATFLIFQVTMRRARIRMHHVARCVFYSAEATWLVLALPMATAVLLLWIYFTFELPIYPMLFSLLCLVTLSVFAYRLSRALALYLKFDHALGVTLATQTISLLIWLNLWLGHRIGWRW